MKIRPGSRKRLRFSHKEISGSVITEMLTSFITNNQDDISVKNSEDCIHNKGLSMSEISEASKKKQAKWGFDLTKFESADDFKEVLELIGASEEPSQGKYGQFIWKGKKATVVTGNNPITGHYMRVNQRDPEVGYASYIGISGDDAKIVKQVADKIKELTSDIKDESPNSSDFIGEETVCEDGEVKLHSTQQSDVYYTNFSNLPKKAQEALEKAEVEIENSKYTVWEDSAFIRADVEVNGALWEAEISLGSVDIKNAGYEYDSSEDEYVDDQGRPVDSSEHAEYMASELRAVTELKHQDVYLTHIKDLDEEKQMKESQDKKVVKHKIVDHGMENSSYFRGHGISGTDYEDTATGVGSTVEQAIEDAAEQLAQNGWELSEELEKEIEKIKKEEGGVTVGHDLSIFAHVANGKVEDFHVEDYASLLSDDEQNEKVSDDIENGNGQIHLSAQTLDIEPAVDVMIDACKDAGVEIPAEQLSKLEKEIRQIQDMSEHYYYISIDVSSSDEETDKPLTPFFTKTPKKESKEVDQFAKLQEDINEFKKALTSDQSKLVESFKKSSALAEKVLSAYSSMDSGASAIKPNLSESVKFMGLDLELPEFEVKKSINEDIDVMLGFTKKTEALSEEVKAVRTVCADLKKISEDAKKLAVTAEKGMLAEDDAERFLTDMTAYLKEAVSVICESEDDAEELRLYADNTGEIYPKKLEILKRIEKDLKDGVKKEKAMYNQKNAIYAWLKNAARMYQKEIGEKKFSVEAIKKATQDILKDETDEIIHQMEKYGSAYNKQEKKTESKNISEGKWSPDASDLVSYAMNVEPLYLAIEDEKKSSSPDWEMIADAIIADYEKSTEGKEERQYEGTTDELAAELEKEFGGLEEAQKSLKPPKKWVAKMKKDIPGSDSEKEGKIIGDIWYNKLSKEKKKEIRGREGKEYGPANESKESEAKLRQKLLELMANTSKDSEEIDAYEADLLKMTLGQLIREAEDVGFDFDDIADELSPDEVEKILKPMMNESLHEAKLKVKTAKDGKNNYIYNIDGVDIEGAGNLPDHLEQMRKVKNFKSNATRDYIRAKGEPNKKKAIMKWVKEFNPTQFVTGWTDGMDDDSLDVWYAPKNTFESKESDTISKVKAIVSDQQAEKIDGMLVDLTTANAIMTVYNALDKEENKSKFAALPIGKMASVAFKLIK